MIVEAELTWTGERFERGARIAINPDGLIAAVGDVKESLPQPMRGIAILPGFVNAHSHSFQRGLRGRGERFSGGAGSFWSWRESMYALVDEMTPETFLELTQQAYREMRAAGITTVGEFHYLHHDRGSDHRFDEIALRAAADVGIRLVLLFVFYSRGGVNQPPSESQRRFATTSLDDYWKQLDALSRQLDPHTQTLGVVAHSIRGAALEEIEALYAGALDRGLPFHMHVEEQQQEIADCVAFYGKAPMALLNERLAIGPKFTAVHCTHTDPNELRRFLSRGGNVCITPLTEGNLGDGIPTLTTLEGRFDQISLGTDSNARISMIEEMRWLEYGQRLKNQMRGAFAGPGGSPARTLLRVATAGGARSLGVNAGAITAGSEADLIAIDLAHPSLAGWTDETLLDSIVFGSGSEVVKETMVAGRWGGAGA